jgi:hypothetical protein
VQEEQKLKDPASRLLPRRSALLPWQLSKAKLYGFMGRSPCVRTSSVLPDYHYSRCLGNGV